MVDSILLACISFSITVALLIALKAVFLKRGFLLSRGIPLVGGIAIGASFAFISFMGLAMRGALSRSLCGVIIASLAMLVLGVIDDWRELSVTAKVIVQLAATLVLYSFGVKTEIVYIGPLLNALVTFIWVIGITNAFNHLDVIDGLSVANAFISACAFLAISFLNADYASGILFLSLAGAIMGMLFFNLPPARLYLGNSGSHFLGFVLAALALGIHYAPLERKIALFTPLLILGFAIFDTLFLISMRIKKKKLPFDKSNDHLVLRFLSSGFSKDKALGLLALVALFFSFSGILVSRVSNLAGAVIVAGVILVCVLVYLRMSKVSVNG